MISPQSRELLNNMDKTPFGIALKEYFDSELKELRDIVNCTPEEFQGRKLAVKIILKLSTLMETEPEKPISKNQYI